MIVRLVQCCAILAVVSAGLLLGSRSAGACSGGPRDQWAAADIVVLGRVVSLEMLPDEGVGDGPDRMSPVRVTAEVLDVAKGDAPARVSWVERWASGDPRAHPSTWAFTGGGGDCSTLRENPLGRYTLAFLARGRDGELALGLPSMGYRADPDRFEAVLARYALPSGMPQTGGGGKDARPPLEVASLPDGSVPIGLGLTGAVARRTGAAPQSLKRWKLDHAAHDRPGV